MPKARCSPVNLTDLKVKSLKPDPAGEYVQGDTQVPGFGIRVRPQGAAVYIVANRLPGEAKPIRVTLGRVGAMTLAEARDKARAAAAAVRSGVDVNADKRRAAEQRKRERHSATRILAETGFPADSFGELATRYIERECVRLARGTELARLIRRELLPVFGVRPFAELRRRDLNELAVAIAGSGRPAAALKVREVGKRIAAWGEDQELIERNPFLGGRSPIRREDRARALSTAEVAALWRAWERMGVPLGAFMMFALATGQRRGEIATMENAELDLEGQLWTIPGAKAKNRKEHLVPLSSLAVQILTRVPAIDDRYVWSTRPGTRISGFSKAKTRAVELSGVTEWRLHDLRRTAATRLAELGIPHPVVGKLLNHSPRGVMGVTSIYNRYEYLEERRGAMEAWARRIRDIVDPPPANIVDLRAAS